MSKKQNVPPGPDLTELTNISREAVQFAKEQADSQLAWAKEQFAANKGVTDAVVGSFLRTQDFQQKNAEHDRKLYEERYQPLEGKLAEEAASFASDERKQLEVGRAKATVAQSMGAQKRNAQQALENFGVNPGATRFAALDIGFAAQQGAAEAGAANQASQMVDATGRALRSEAINVGKGYPGQIAGTYNTALQAGQGAVNSSLATTGSGANTMGTPVQYAGLGNQATAGWGNMLNQQYSNVINATKVNNAASSGLGTALGLAGGAIASFVEHGGKIPNQERFFATGGPSQGGAGAIPLGPPPPAAGPAVPASADPTGGAIPDGVPARLNPGEFVMPKPVVEWYGEKGMHDIILKAQREKEKALAETGAQPEMKPAIPQAPTFVSQGTA